MSDHLRFRAGEHFIVRFEEPRPAVFIGAGLRSETIFSVPRRLHLVFALSLKLLVFSDQISDPCLAISTVNSNVEGHLQSGGL